MKLFDIFKKKKNLTSNEVKQLKKTKEGRYVLRLRKLYGVGDYNE